MFPVHNFHTPWRHVLLPLGLGLLALMGAFRGPALADNYTYVIGSSEGSGITECLVDGIACGRVVADAWCESHAEGPVKAFGLASDITNSIGRSGAPAEPGAVVITCGD